MIPIVTLSAMDVDKDALLMPGTTGLSGSLCRRTPWNDLGDCHLARRFAQAGIRCEPHQRWGMIKCTTRHWLQHRSAGVLLARRRRTHRSIVR